MNETVSPGKLTRQQLYERYYTGDPIVGRVLFFNAPKTREAEALAERLLGAVTAD